MLRFTGNGQGIPAHQVQHILNLGHTDRSQAVHMAGEEEGPEAGTPPAPTPIYGLFGHGFFLAVNALAHHAFWLGK